MRILLVEDDKRTASFIMKGLRQEGFAVDCAADGEELALAFNEMIERIETLIRELKEVTDNVAHDQRSPLTRIRGIAETTLTGK
jgi:signal transduction histidine kinase